MRAPKKKTTPISRSTQAYKNQNFLAFTRVNHRLLSIKGLEELQQKQKGGNRNAGQIKDHKKMVVKDMNAAGLALAIKAPKVKEALLMVSRAVGYEGDGLPKEMKTLEDLINKKDMDFDRCSKAQWDIRSLFLKNGGLPRHFLEPLEEQEPAQAARKGGKGSGGAKAKATAATTPATKSFSKTTTKTTTKPTSTIITRAAKSPAATTTTPVGKKPTKVDGRVTITSNKVNPVILAMFNKQGQELKDLKAAFKDLKLENGKLTKRMKAAETKAEAASEGVKEVGARLDVVEEATEGVEAMREELTTTTETAEAASQGVDDVNTRVDDVEASVGELEDVAEGLEALREDLTDLDDRVDELEESVGGLEVATEGLEATLTTATGDITTIRAELTTTTATANAARQGVTDVRTRVQTVEDSVEELEEGAGDLEALETRVGQHYDAIMAQAGDLETLDGRIGQVGDFEALTGRVTFQEARSQRHSESLGHHHQRIKRNTEDLDDLYERVKG